MKIKTLIIDDEEPARALLIQFLSEKQEIDVIGEIANGFSAVKQINELKPDLVFLDIQMPRLTGFEVLELIEHQPLIIFATAFDQFAIKAFDMNAVDYLLKPFTRERLDHALKKILIKFSDKKNMQPNLNDALRMLDEQPATLERIAVKTGSNIHVISTDHIIYLEAEGDYVLIHTNDGKHLKEKTMKYFENHLDNAQFVRIHRSYIVNVNVISKIELYDKENYLVLLKDNSRLKASSNGYKQLKNILKI